MNDPTPNALDKPNDTPSQPTRQTARIPLSVARPDTRKEQGRLLAALPLKTYRHKQRSVSAAVQIGVLKEIWKLERDGNACYASQQYTTKETKIQPRQVSTAVAALEAQGLILTERRPGRSSLHRIRWDGVRAMLSQEGNATAAPNSNPGPEDIGTPDLKSYRAGPEDRSTPDLGTAHPGPEDRHNRKKHKPLTSTTDDAELEGLKQVLFESGMHYASDAIDAARKRGLSVAYVRYLIEQRTQVDAPIGTLCNWLTGKTQLPITPERFQQSQSDNAEAIRTRCHDELSKRGQPDWIASAATFDKLNKADLEEFATDHERAAAERWQRERPEPKPEGTINRAGNTSNEPLQTLAEESKRIPSKQRPPKATPKRASSTGISPDSRKRELREQAEAAKSGSAPN